MGSLGVSIRCKYIIELYLIFLFLFLINNNLNRIMVEGTFYNNLINLGIEIGFNILYLFW